MRKSANDVKRSSWPLVLAIVGPPLLIAAVAVPMVMAGAPVERGNLWVGASPYGPTSSASAADVRVALDALHRIGAQCLKTSPDPLAVRGDVAIITRFAERNPVGRFPIDDETATASSLLIVTREAIKTCAPDQVTVINAALKSVEPR
ncbi:MAG: hypothetical protein HIU88_13145 [Acidobacteria bacterium]|nr:hypothetical protein [Acidobacteriota bacterium]